MNSNCQILDCTLRDGGLVNDSAFTPDFAKSIVSACARAGVDIVEVGFKNSRKHFSPDKYGVYRFCDEDVVRAAKGGENVKISVLMDVLKSDADDLLPKSDSAIDMVRCAFYFPQLDHALELLDSAAQKGYETAACMMAVSTLSRAQVAAALQKMSSAKSLSTIYLMDSFGALIPPEASELALEYANACARCGKKFGVHAHNNIECAFANELAAISCGAQIADCTVGGLGKGAGNCPTELLVGKMRGADKSLPIIQAAQNLVEPIKKKYSCGNYPQYMLTGLLNKHPRAAMEAIAEGRNCVSEFFDIISK